MFQRILVQYTYIQYTYIQYTYSYLYTFEYCSEEVPLLFINGYLLWFILLFIALVGCFKWQRGPGRSGRLC